MQYYTVLYHTILCCRHVGGLRHVLVADRVPDNTTKHSNNINCYLYVMLF